MTDGSDVDAVFWDIGGVILDLRSVPDAHERFLETLLAEYESDHTVDEAVEIWRETVGSYFRDREETEFRPARRGYRLAVEEILAEDVPPAAWEATFERTVEEHAEPNPDAVVAIEELADRPIHQGVVSDVDHDEGRRLLEAFGVFDHVDSFTTSESVGRTKPHPSMFETAVEAAGVDPARSVMIGDRYVNDMEGGTAAGMTTVAYHADGEGPAVDHELDDLRDLPALLGVED